MSDATVEELREELRSLLQKLNEIQDSSMQAQYRIAGLRVKIDALEQKLSLTKTTGPSEIK